MARDLFTECAEQLAGSPALVAQLLAAHSPAADGWCRGHSAHRERFPCSIRRLAELATGAAAPVPARPRPAPPTAAATAGAPADGPGPLARPVAQPVNGHSASPDGTLRR